MSALIESEAEEGLGTDEELEDAESIAGSAISEVAGDEDINNSEDEEGLDEDLEGFVVHGDVDQDGVEAVEEPEAVSNKASGSESDEDDSPKKKKRRRRLSEEVLTDDDYDLLEENLGVKMKRKKFSRVRMADSDEDEDKEEEGNDRDELAKTLFDSGDEDDIVSGTPQRPSGTPQRETSQFQDIGSEGESDTEVDDFIVDDQGRPVKTEDRSQFGTHDSLLREAEEIFGDGFEFDKIAEEMDEFDEDDDDEEYDYGDEDGIEGGRKKKKKKKADVNIYDVYEPFDLEKGHFTKQDNEIRMTDLPERFQLRSQPVVEADAAELEAEAKWIFEQAFQARPLSYQGDVDEFGQIMLWDPKPASAEAKIKNVLNLIRNDKFEVPFITTYRKEFIKDDLVADDLWKIYEWDEKWMRLNARKQKLKSLMMKVQQYQFERTRGSTFTRTERILEAEDIDRVDTIQSTEEFNDIYAHFHLYYNIDIVDMQNAAKANATFDGLGNADQCKLSQKRNPYSMCKDKELGNLAKRFGLTSIQFAENLNDQYCRHTVEQCPLMPEDAAKEFECRRFPDSKRVLEGTRYMIARQIACEPLVRQCVRNTYFERAMISIEPTSKGYVEIDDNHLYGSFKFLKDKTVRDLSGDQFLRMYNAQKEGLIKMTINMDKKGSKDTYLEEIKVLYYRDEFSQLVQNWNEQRTLALTLALDKMLYPALEKELITKLLEEASQHVLKSCRMKLRTWLNMAPYTVENLDDSNHTGMRILGICIQDVKDAPCFGVLINGDGELAETLTLSYFRFRDNGDHDMAKGKRKDIDTLQDFLLEQKPHVIAICCESSALKYQKEFQEVVSLLEQQNQMDPIAVELVNPIVARLYRESSRAKSEFPNLNLEQRMATSIARRLRDPLVEFCQLCNFTSDILNIPWHPLQKTISSERILRVLQEEFVNKVNEVGVDINFAVDHYHYQTMIQFVCGIGPRKGSALLKLLKQSPDKLETRSCLIMKFSLGSRVFLNSSGFIKIEHMRDDSMSENSDPLDSTRIHPETYSWAKKMAIDALEYDDDEETEDSNNQHRALEEIMEDPEKLRDLDLDAFAEELERQCYTDKRITLYDIRDELTARYADKRVPYHALTDEERFYLVANETPETFKENVIVVVKCIGIARRRPKGDENELQPKRNEENGMWQCPLCLRDNFPELSELWNHFDTSGSCPGQAVGVRCILNNGIRGFLSTKNISDSKVTNPEDKIKIDKQIHAKVVRINFDKVSVELSCKSSDLNSGNEKGRDLFYDTDAADKLKKDKAAKKNKTKNVTQYINRVIVHPNFYNISYTACEKLLKDREQGSIIIRPSRKGTTFLTLTWKVDTTNNIMSHIEIQEEDKDNQFSLGKKLRIDDEEFEDLDEVIARYVDPMVRYARDILSFKYFKDGVNMDMMNTVLRNDKNLTPKRVPYYISACVERPGRFRISYMPRSQTLHESITITNHGYRYRNKIHSSFISLIKWFKEHWSDAPPVANKAQSTIGGRSAVTDYTADFTEISEPFQTPRSGTYGSDANSAVGSNVSSVISQKYPTQSPRNTPAYNMTPSGRTPGPDFRAPNTPILPNRTPGGGRTPGSRTPGQMSQGQRTPGYPSGERTPGGRTPGGPPRSHPGGRTPGSSTPGYPAHPGGSRTPGGRTPGAYSVGSRTPGSRTPGYPGDRTPGSRTPGSRTPGYPGDRTPGGSSRPYDPNGGYHKSPRKAPGTPGSFHGHPSPGRPSPSYGQPSPARSYGQHTPRSSGSRTPMSLMERPDVIASQSPYGSRTPQSESGREYPKTPQDHPRPKTPVM